MMFVNDKFRTFANVRINNLRLFKFIIIIAGAKFPPKLSFITTLFCGFGKRCKMRFNGRIIIL
jgi:hypothetical protein